MREKLDAWLRDGGTIRVVPISAFVGAVLPGIIPLWLELGTFPRRAPRDGVDPPLLVGWIAVFLGAEGARRYLAKRATRPAGAAPDDHPEDFGRGPWWRLAELLFLGVILQSPPPAPRIRIHDDEDELQA